MIREVHFLSRSQAMTMAPYGREGIISITSPGEGRANLRKGWRRVLRLQFHDILRATPKRTLFGDEHADAIFEWLGKVDEHLDALYVHCQAGKHRSAAVAKFIAERYDLSGGVRVYEDHNPLVYRILVRRWRRMSKAASLRERGGQGEDRIFDESEEMAS
jgi:hypothetical protein